MKELICCAVLGILVTGCTSLPPLGQELSKEPGVSLRRVEDTGEWETRGTQSAGRYTLEMMGELPDLIVQLPDAQRMASDTEVPAGTYQVVATRASREEAQEAIARAIESAIGPSTAAAHAGRE